MNVSTSRIARTLLLAALANAVAGLQQEGQRKPRRPTPAAPARPPPPDR